MKHFERILAPTDLSHPSLSVVSYAAHLAQTQDAKLTVLHVPVSTAIVYAEYLPAIDMSGIDDTVERSALEHLERWAERGLRRTPDAKLLVRAGRVTETICRVAEEIDASVIVMATHGRTGVSHLLLGSVTESVLREAPCPVLAVKPPPAAGKKKASPRKRATTAK